MKKTIKREKLQNREKRIKYYSQTNLKSHTKTIKAMFLVLFYISLFIWIVLLQLQLTARYNQTSVKEAIENELLYSSNSSQSRNLE